jgi:hypothetical protein
MKKWLQLILTSVVSLFFNQLHAQIAPNIEWQKCLGGTGSDAAFSIQQTTDGGYIVAGFADSNDGDVTGNHGASDYWIVKLDEASNILWEKSFGGTSSEEALSIDQTTDGGYIVAGYSYSIDGDVSGNHGNDDYWILKLDGGGNLSWQKCLGGSGIESATAIHQTYDGGYIVCGYASSINGDVTGNHGLLDYWLVKLNEAGNLVWQHSYGGNQNDVANSVQQTADSGFIISGFSESNDGDVPTNGGLRDYWIVKTDATGNLQWTSVLGGSGFDEGESVNQLSDGTFIVAGYTASVDGDVTGNHGIYDYWLVKLDTIGNIIWKYCFGGTSVDQPFAVQPTSDKGFIVVGQASSTNGDVTGNHGNYDFWAVKLDSNANLTWQKSLGGSYDEYGPFSVQQTLDGGYIMCGSSLSYNGDVTGNHGGISYGDCWVVKLEGDVPTAIESVASSDNFSLYPNPVQTELNIDLKYTAKETSIRVYDLEGRLWDCGFRILNSGLGGSIQVSTKNLADGFYTIQIIDNKTGEIEVGKFVKGK